MPSGIIKQPLGARRGAFCECNITKPYYLDRFEVTVSEWMQCMAAGKCTSPEAGKYCQATTEVPLDNYAMKRYRMPVNCVGHAKAAAYCLWRHQRLPTEAEWEMAARGSCKANGATSQKCAAGMRLYPWGNSPPSCSLTVTKGTKNVGCDTGKTMTGGSKPRDLSPYGLYDMGGNLREHVQDIWTSSFPSAAVKNPAGPSSGITYVIRYGSLADADHRSSNRNWVNSTYAKYYYGFRCAGTVP